MSFLSEIVYQKRRRVEAAEQAVSLRQIYSLAQDARAGAPAFALSTALKNEERINIIAEFKRKSPSRGQISNSADPASMAHAYELGGAGALSVLTEEDYFDGSLDDLRAVRNATTLPILRKDFIFEEYQVYESAAAGADALLLIVAALDDEALIRLRRLTENDLRMDALVEVHTREEFDRAVGAGANLIGVNNRDLHTFSVSMTTSIELAPLAPAAAILVSESGLNPEQVRKLRLVGYKGFLVGEALMRAGDPGEALREFTQTREDIKEEPAKQ
jgi:indole-3-glycerol phosphate synthase